MRGILNPHKSAAHKLACLSLYRGLLRQATRLNYFKKGSTLLNLIKRRFRLDRKCQSPTVICDALKTGREAYAHIHEAANGSHTATVQLLETLEDIIQYDRQQQVVRGHVGSLWSACSNRKLKKIFHFQDYRSKLWAEQIPNPIPICERPVSKDKLPNQSRPRQIPILTAAQGFPFLRYKSGAQSPKLTRALNSFYTQELKRWETHNRLLEEIDHALLEDTWDKIVYQQTGHSDAEEGSPSKSWADDTRVALKELQNTLKEAASAKADRAQRMWEIMQKEKELAIKEKKEQKVLARQEADRPTWSQSQGFCCVSR